MRTSRLDKGGLEKDIIDIFVGIRWPRGPRCFYCESRHVKLMNNRAIFHCSGCRKQFAVFKGTQFEGTRLLPSQLYTALSWFYQNAGTLTVREIQSQLETKRKAGAYASAHRLSQKLRSIPMNWETPPRLNDFIRRALFPERKRTSLNEAGFESE